MSVPICCEDCFSSTFRLTWDGDVYCATCDDDETGSYGRMADLNVVGDGGPDGPIGPKHLIYPHTCQTTVCAGCREEEPHSLAEVVE